ncbi:unnamed protein product [Ceutorhynchus assimilis]|uniref:RING-type domain-containing protein n=1 Tax=Ceutorhynchus assimilis TaxID=467358 RepID=A0A9N9MEV3_9CUCU|nr:unnamed protein product [Ceutorhynchus assimilis]
MVVPFLNNCDIFCAMFKRKKSVNKQRLEHKLYLARETPEPVFDLSDCDLINVPTGIYSLCKVFLKESLMLQNNQLTTLSGGGELKDLINLRVLDISSNDFHQLPDDVCLLKNLQEFYADNNYLKSLPNSMCHLVNLKILSLANNNLKSLPEDLGLLKQLQKIRLSCNKHLKSLPKNICKLKGLVLIEIDWENMVYPPRDVIEMGTEAIMKYISNDVGFEYIPNEAEIENSPVPEPIDEPDRLQEKLLDLEQVKLKRVQEFLEIERSNEIMQKQEVELANVHKANREKLLASLSRQQSKFDLKLSQLQQEKENERFRLVEQLQEVEINADFAINNLLMLSKEPTQQLLDKEQEEEEKLLAAVNRYNETLHKSDILEAMQNILRQETEMFLKFDNDRIETSRSILEQELESDSKLAKILQDQDTQKANLMVQLIEDRDLQKAAVGTLLERGDARSWGLLQQLRLVEMQLLALTNIEIDRKKLKMDEQLNDLSEKRINLSVLLIDLLEQQKQRRAQLLSTLQIMEEFNSDNMEDFWLRQYQRLLEKLPDGLSRAQKNIDPKLAEILLANGVLHCLPFLAKLTQCQSNAKSITEQHLIEAGIRIPLDRQKILDSLRIYSKEHISTTPSAPVLENEASAPQPEEIKAINSIECVICLDLECTVIFVPCGHLCCCAGCSGAVQECPLCRTKIERKITIIAPH